jgi:hypothetical protein
MLCHISSPVLRIKFELWLCEQVVWWNAPNRRKKPINLCMWCDVCVCARALSLKKEASSFNWKRTSTRFCLMNEVISNLEVLLRLINGLTVCFITAVQFWFPVEHCFGRWICSLPYVSLLRVCLFDRSNAAPTSSLYNGDISFCSSFCFSLTQLTCNDTLFSVVQ